MGNRTRQLLRQWAEHPLPQSNSHAVGGVAVHREAPSVAALPAVATEGFAISSDRWPPDDTFNLLVEQQQQHQRQRRSLLRFAGGILATTIIVNVVAGIAISSSNIPWWAPLATTILALAVATGVVTLVMIFLSMVFLAMGRARMYGKKRKG